MNDTNVLQVLQELRFLQEIEEPHLEQIAAVSHCQEFTAGEVIFREGEASQDVFLIHAGSVSLEICAPGVGCRRIMTAGDGELLGWSPILDQSALTATARALSPARVVAMNAKQMLAICEQNPRFGYEFMRRTALALARRLSAARLQLIDVYGTQMAHTADSHTGNQGGG